MCALLSFTKWSVLCCLLIPKCVYSLSESSEIMSTLGSSAATTATSFFCALYVNIKITKIKTELSVIRPFHQEKRSYYQYLIVPKSDTFYFHYIFVKCDFDKNKSNKLRIY